MQIRFARILLLSLLTWLLAGSLGSEPALAEAADTALDPGGLIVRRDAVSRTIHVELAEEDGAASREARRRPKLGKIKVKNESSLSAAIYWSLDDLVTPWFYVDTLPPGWKVKFKLPKKTFYLLAAEAPIFGPDELWEWGPRALYLKKRYKWTLLN